jgi:hypothetical protein
MARVKAPPRVAQPYLERQAYTSKPQAISGAINEYQLKSSQASDDENNHDTNKPILPKTATVTGSEQPLTEKPSAAEELVSIGHRLALTNLACPQCLSKFPDMGIKVSQIYSFRYSTSRNKYHRPYLIAFTELS